jgi:hypothetical protein
MKKILQRIGIAAMFVFAFATLKAQDMQAATAQEHAAKMTDWMKTNLTLTDSQVPKVTDINLRYATTMDSLKNSPGDQTEKMSTMKADNTAKDLEIKGVLTDSQYQVYQAKEAEMKAKNKSQMKTPASGQ